MQRFSGMTLPVAQFLAQRVFCILPEHDPLDRLSMRVSARDFGRWVRDLPALLAREGPVGVPPVLKELAQEEEKMESPISPVSAMSNVTATGGVTTSLLAQSLAQAFAQQEQAASSGSSGPSSPAWRHRRGLSNASIGFPLSSVPQSRRPSSRQASFSIPGIASGNVSAAGSRAATPHLRGRTLSLLGPGASGMSRAPSGTREAVVSELPTVFDEEAELDLSSGSLGLSHVSNKGPEGERERGNENDNDNDDNDREHDHDHDHDQEESGSRSQSMVRRRKRGARKGKGQIIQQQQQEIARLQEQQATLQAQFERLASVVAAQHAQVTSPLPVSPLSPNLMPPQSVPLSPVQAMGGQGDTLDTLASASEALARELSRTSRSNSQSHSQNNHRTPVAPIPLPLPLCTGNALTLAASTSARGSRSNSVAAATSHTPNGVHPQNYPALPYGHAYPHGFNTGASHGPAPVHMRPIPGNAARDVSPSRVPSVVSAGVTGPTPGALYPVAFPAHSGASTTSEAAAYASSIISASSASSAATGAVSVVSAPTIAKKTSKWKLSFGKSSSSVNSTGSNASGSSRPPIPAMQNVLDISRKNSEVSLGSVAGSAKSLQKSENGAGEEQARHAQQQAGTTSATAISVTNVLMGLNSSATTKVAAGAPSVTSQQTPPMQPPPSGPIPPVPNLLSPPSTSEVWSRGRRPAGPNASTWGPSHDRDRDRDRWPHGERERNVSPNSVRNGARGTPVASSASSVSNSSYSSNWRNSTATGSSASSAFTRFSNGSVRSVSTVATSVSGGSAVGSWRNSNNGHNKPGPPPSVSSRNSDARLPPPNVKSELSSPRQVFY